MRFKLTEKEIMDDLLEKIELPIRRATLKKTSENVNISTINLSRIINGKACPSLLNFIKLANFCGFEISLQKTKK